MPKRSKNLLALLLSVIVLISIASASAVTLPIKTNSLTTQKNKACTTTTLAAGINASNNLTLSNIPASCYNLSLTAKVLQSGSNTPLTVTGTLGSTSTYTATTTISSPNTIIAVRSFIASWYIPTSWTYTAAQTDPVSPSSSTPGTTTSTTWSQPASTSFCASIVVSTTSTTPITWKADLNIVGAPFNGDTNINDYQINAPYYYGFVSSTPVNGAFTLQGLQPSSSTVVNGTSQTIQVCNYNTPPATTNPNVTYTQTETTPTPSYYVCKTVTVTTTGATQFYVGWTATVDVTNLKNNYVPGTGGSVQGPFGGYSRTQVGTSNVYTITGTGYNTQGIKDGSPANFQICWG